MSSLSLNARIKRAQLVLSASFGQSQQSTNPDVFDVYKYLNEEELAQVYADDAGRKEVTDQLLNIAKSIKNMRSSILPISFFLEDISRDSFISDIENTTARKEPYENTFMRMLGLPSVSDFQYGVTREYSKVSPDDIFLAIEPNTGDLVELTFYDIKDQILEQRKKPRIDRRFVINNTIYNFSGIESLTYSGLKTLPLDQLDDLERADLLSITYRDVGPDQYEFFYTDREGSIIQVDPYEISEISRKDDYSMFKNPFTGEDIPFARVSNAGLLANAQAPNDVNLQNLSEDLYKFSYLLVPPIQDPQLSNAVSETDKIVAPPFASPIYERVNESSPRPPLLETIIRIRLDKVSGFSSELIDDATLQGDGDDYGILEALFIVRLKSSIIGLGKKMTMDVDLVIDQVERARRYAGYSSAESGQEAAVGGTNTYDSGDTATPTQQPGSLQEDDSSQNSELNPNTENQGEEGSEPAQDQGTSIVQSSLLNLESQKLIEDSILFLLADDTKVLDLQYDIQRSSSVYNSHMMSGLINIIDVPRKRIEAELNASRESRDTSAETNLDPKFTEIGNVLGVDIGIGSLDLAVFALALFTLSEDSLLGLLSPAQFDRLKNGNFGYLIREDVERRGVVQSINELTKLIHEGYELFKNSFDSTEHPDAQTDEGEEVTELNTGGSRTPTVGGGGSGIVHGNINTVNERTIETWARQNPEDAKAFAKRVDDAIGDAPNPIAKRNRLLEMQPEGKQPQDTILAWAQKYPGEANRVFNNLKAKAAAQGVQ